MINLLAPEIKRELRAAKRNVLLRRYFVLMLSISIAMVSVFGVGYYLTWNDKQRADQEHTEQLSQVQGFQATKQAAMEYSKNLATAKVILAKQTSASRFLTNLAATLPKNVILSQVNLSSSTLATDATTFDARAKSFTDVLALKDNLEKSPLFENVSILSAQQAEGTELSSKTTTTYPVNATINLTISAGATL